MRNLRRLAAVKAAGLSLAVVSPAFGQLSKGYQVLLARGLQVEGLVTRDNGFHLAPADHAPADGSKTGGYFDVGYNTIIWSFASTNAPNSNVSALGAAPGVPWARWVDSEAHMPPAGDEGPYMANLVSLELADEQNLNDDATRTAAVNWFKDVQANSAYDHTILYTNSYGGQVGDAQLVDFVQRAKPDMMSVDAYPFKAQYVANGTGNPADYTPLPAATTITPYYSELRRYRDISKAAGIPFQAYMQTFSAVEDYDSIVYRDPSPSELNLNNYAALAFGAKALVGFTYNSGASSLFVNDHHGGGDKTPTALYAAQKTLNARLKNWGNTLVRLTPINDYSTDGTTTNTLFLRGKHFDASSNSDVLDGIPANFVPSGNNPNAAFTQWTANKNDAYLRGWTVTNTGTKNADPSTGAKLAGDVILSWFKPLDESFDGVNFTDERYMMLVNGLTDPTGSTADCTQTIRLNFLGTTPDFQVLNPDTGAVDLVHVNVDPTTGRKLWDITLGGGEAILFKFNDGAPFILPEPAALAPTAAAAAALLKRRRPQSSR